MFIYYVYAYLRKSDNTPYYIGKGKKDRAYNGHHGVSIPKDRSKIVILESNLSNVGACAIERRMIKWYGRMDLRTGILLNKTNGGEGGKGGSKKGRIFSESMKKKLSIAGRKRIQSEETRKKISLAHTGKKRQPFSDEWRDNLSKSRLGKKTRPRTEKEKQHLSDLNSKPVYCVTNDIWYKSKKEAALKLGLKAANITHCLLGYQKSTGGFVFTRKKYDAQF